MLIGLCSPTISTVIGKSICSGEIVHRASCETVEVVVVVEASHLQTVDESAVIKYLAPIPAVTPYAAPETAIQHVVPASAVTYTSLAPVTEYVAPTTDATIDETDDTFAAPAPVVQYVALAPADTDTTKESMTVYVAPAPAVYHATPAPRIEFASPVIEYSPLTPSVTCFTPSPQLLLAYTMGAPASTCIGHVLPKRVFARRGEARRNNILQTSLSTATW